jgi:uncharacterized damage-inducible protein DinB
MLDSISEGSDVSEAQLIRTMFLYKAWANAEILATMTRFDEQVHATERQTAIRILNHTYVVDRIFAANLRGETHEYTASNTTDTPSLELLSGAIKTSDEWYVDYVGGLGLAALGEVVDFAFTDGDFGRMSRAEMLTHVVLHGGYHRGAVGRIMAQLSITPPRDVFTGYLHKAEPAARRRVG